MLKHAPALVAAVFVTVGAAFGGSEERPLSLEVETGSPLHVVDWPITNVPVAVVHGRGILTGPLKVSDSYGRSFTVRAQAGASDGDQIRVPLSVGADGLSAKGVWRVAAEVVSTSGKTQTLETTFGVLDPHPVTPRIPYGRFRYGVHLHVMRHQPPERPLTLDAAVRMGAKIVRLDDCFSGWATWNRKAKTRDWTQADAMLAELERRGLAVDAIVFENLGAHGGDAFFEAIAARYRDRIDYYEVGNEWDLLPRERFPVETAIATQKLAYAALKRGFPQARVSSNGWAVEDSAGHANVTQKGFQERFLSQAKGFYDIHAMHLHFPFANYEKRLNRFLEMRREQGADAPWILNETALSVQYRGEKTVAENVWQKILYGWAKGAKDYLWYNLRANKPDPGGYYGMMSRDYRPRLHYAAFSAFATVFDGCDMRATLADAANRKVFLLSAADRTVIAGWDAAATAPMRVRVKTDAARAFHADIMNNRHPLDCVNGMVEWRIDAEPSALILYGAKHVDALPEDVANVARPAPRCIHVEKIRLGYGWDLLVDKYEQVHEEYPADPATAHRTWKGTKDCSGVLLFTTDGTKAQVKVAVTDDVDWPGSDRVEVWRDGRNVTPSLAFKRVRHGDKRTVYVADWPDTRPCRINLRIVDDDGFGGIDGWMDYAPFDAAHPDDVHWPVVRFN